MKAKYKNLALILLLQQTKALQPQISSISVWDEVSGLNNLMKDGEDQFVQLDSSLESQTQSTLGLQSGLEAQIEAKLNAANKGKMTLGELNRSVAKHLLQSDINKAKHLKLLENKRKRQEKEAPVSLAQIQSISQESILADLILEEEIVPVEKGVASVKAPTDPAKLALVQLNNEKPQKKKLKQVQLLQLSSDIQIDEKEKQSQGQQEATKMKSLVEAFTKEYLHEADQAVEAALTDNSEGANERAKESAYVWTKLNTNSYSKAEVSSQGGTVAQGMEQTGGYIGTDLEETKHAKVLAQVRSHINSLQEEHLHNLKKERRLCREKILCAENCQFEKWSYHTGISLNENCPIDCSLSQLIGTMKEKTSIAALEAYDSFYDISDLRKNKKELESIEIQISENELLFQQEAKKSGLSLNVEEELQVDIDERGVNKK